MLESLGRLALLYKTFSIRCLDTYQYRDRKDWLDWVDAEVV